MATYALTDYVRVIGLFLSKDLTAKEFKRTYQSMFKEDPEMRPQNQYEILNGLFGDAECYCDDEELRGEYDIDEDELRASAEKALNALNQINTSS